ncbi:MAG: ribbon-helix-helix protein, CopG family [Synechococcaceae cyanobacterium]|nr:ribbon-helix-helix protein, CopG family [Synechococcaceae cyanobacterium]
MPTRQTSSSGRPKSPRIQVVLPEDLCERLAELAEAEARTVSNMARVLIQQGVERLERRNREEEEGGAPGRSARPTPAPASRTDRFREALERQGQRAQPRRRARRLRIWRPS